jgi:hypothetical protein
LLRQQTPEDILCAPQHRPSKLSLFVIDLVCCGRLLDLLGLNRHILEELPWIASKQANDRREYQYSQTTTAECDTRPHRATILNVSTLPLLSPTHVHPPLFVFVRSLSVLESYHFSNVE